MNCEVYVKKKWEKKTAFLKVGLTFYGQSVHQSENGT